MSKTTFRPIFALGSGCCVATLLVCLVIFSPEPLETISSAQVSSPSPQPSLSPPAAPVDREGYSLVPSGVATNKWPEVRLDFSLKRDDKTPFRGLTVDNIEALLNENPLQLRKDALQGGNNSISILFVLDRSGSMVDTDAGINKLRAAKESLSRFIGGLGPEDTASIWAFDSTRKVVVPPTNKKSDLTNGIGSIVPREPADPYTYLYDAIDSALREAAKKQIKFIVVLSDGWEDTADSRKMLPAQLDTFKRQREEDIARVSRAESIRIYSLAIGARGDKDILRRAFVDYESMCNISEATGGGHCYHIDLPKLKGQAGNSIPRFNTLIEKDIDNVLAEIKKSFSYEHSLTVDFPRDLKQENGELALNFTVDNGRVKLPVVLPYRWDDKTDTPIFVTWKIFDPIFLVTAPPQVGGQNLAQIYLSLLLTIGLFALVPSVFNQAALLRESQQMKKAVIQVGPNSDLLGKRCPNEDVEWGKRYSFQAGDPVIICPNPACRTAHHLSCWEYNGHQCMNRVCERSMKVPSRVLAKYGIGETARKPLT